MSGIIRTGSDDEVDSNLSSDEDGIHLNLDRNKSQKKRYSGPKSKGDEFVVATPVEFVARFGGKQVIDKVLVANNGIAAVKCIRSMREWAYDLFGNEKVIKFVVMATPEDLKANAEYIKRADHYVTVPGGPNNNNYANPDLILETAKRIPVQAVWAGWGHASENPRLPQLLSANNIAFIGPSSHAMWALGDKVAATIIAQSINVPTMPWSGRGIKLDPASFHEDGKLKGVPADDFQKACVHDGTKGLAIAREIGYPVMIKASEGGGGKGIRKARSDEEFSISFRQVETEVPGSPIFIMKCLEKARHLEVQILADQYGQVVSLFGRDCSVQRRHQKIIEEGPVTICKRDIFIQMEKNAVELAKLVGYTSAGTVEYLYDYRSKGVYFLELNPRLQVEHPCTEMITDVNLPAAQLQIAMGIPLHRIKDIRLLYGENPWGDTNIDFYSYYESMNPKGHVIAARITAENPDEGFKPSSGTITELSFRSSNHTWGYFSVAAEGSLHEYADSQFGHLFAWGEDREAARKTMVLALKELSIRGDFRTTVEYLVRLLETDEFKRNKIDTQWLDNLIAEKMKAESPEIIPAVICGALHVGDDLINARFTNYKAALERGQVPKGDSLRNIETVELIHETVKYIVQVTKSGANQYLLVTNDSLIEVDVHRMSDGGLMVSMGDTTYTSFLKEEVDGYRVVINGKTCVFKKENDPTILRSPSPGKLISFMVEDGGHVFAGEAYAEIEVMKMVMPLVANVSGCIHYVKCSGTVLEPGMVIARLSLDDPSKVFKALPYTGRFPQMKHKTLGLKPHQILKHSKMNLLNIVYGYHVPGKHFQDRINEDITVMMKALADPNLPLLEMQELLASISGRIPQIVDDTVKSFLAKYASNITSILNQFPSQQIANSIDNYAATLKKRADRDMFFMNTQGIVQLVQRFRNGVKGYRKAIILGLLRQYLQVEMLFNEGNFEKCVTTILARLKDADKVVQHVFSHANINQKNSLIIRLIDHLSTRDSSLSEEVRALLQDITTLNRQEHAKVTLKARQVLISSQKPSFELRHNQYESIFLSAIDLYGQQFNPENLQKIILSETSVFDLIPTFFYHRNELVRMAALEVYIRRSYQAYDLTQMQHDQLNGYNLIEFTFKLPSNHPNRVKNNRKGGLADLKFQSRPRVFRVRSVSESMDDMSSPYDESPVNHERMGAMVAFNDVDDFLANFDELLKRFTISESLANSISSGIITVHKRSSSSSLNGDEDPIHIINVCIKSGSSTMEKQEEEKEQFQSIINKRKQQLVEHGIRRISIVITNMKGEFPHFYTFRARDEFQEDLTYRHLEPALAFQLELNRMRLFNLKPIPCANKNLHIYYGAAKKEGRQREVTDYRFFIRSIVRHSDFVTKEASFDYLEKASEIQLLEALDELELALSKVNLRTDCNHVFLNFVPTVIIEPQKIEESIRAIVLRHGIRLWKLRVLQAELKMMIRLVPDGQRIPLRLFLSNQSGYSLDIHTYQEVLGPNTGKAVFQSYGSKQGPHHGLPIVTPYVTKDHLQYKRFDAQSQNTTYVYDFPDLFRQSVVYEWKKWTAKCGIKFDAHKEVMKYSELCLDHQRNLISINRLPGENECGIVAWSMTLFTPEYPDGRQVYVCANDMTLMKGSFSLNEDHLYDVVLKRAIEEKVPFVYISANSGARIGLAEDVKYTFKVAWNEPGRPDKGFKYLYVTPAEFKRLTACNSIRAEALKENGECIYKITDIIGKETGIGVENLKGSGLIAGRTSEAYEKIVTMSLVTCRSVGIGSYLNRLTQRVVQVDNSAIILTGYHALNKLLGRQVYTSNTQLGGTQIMYKNGVSHMVVNDDFSGVVAIVKWLSYVPKAKGQPLPIMPCMDPIDREIKFSTAKSSYDMRHLVTGREKPDIPSQWETGMFDKGSFIEVMGEWAQTVICGRARLGGIPVGVVAPETHPVETTIPPDPADLSSESKSFMQAGQVWYPDSSYKTAQAINDFNMEELPLIIIANWRGFSGGMKDMYDQVLKFGSYIVDALRKYKQPVLSYIPPHGELRGGAWVVIDPSINSEHMEMYADEDSRGGILEPAGTCEIRFKQKDLLKTMKRLDEKYAKLTQEVSDPELTSEAKRKLEKQIQEREKALLPIYQQIAVTYADLHDTAGRMQEKGVVNGILKWKDARKSLYWRLKRLLLLDRIVKMMEQHNQPGSKTHTETVVQRLFLEQNGSVQSYLWEDNEFVCNWIETDLSGDDENSLIKEHVKWYKRDAMLREIKSIVDKNPDIAMDAIVHITQQITSAKRNELSRVLSALNKQCDDTNENKEESSANELRMPPRTVSIGANAKDDVIKGEDT